jgi:hypothetical protein
MPRILRRPMFRGGPVRSEGTGITSGLDQGYAQGGRVGYADGPDMFGVQYEPSSNVSSEQQKYYDFLKEYGSGEYLEPGGPANIYKQQISNLEQKTKPAGFLEFMTATLNPFKPTYGAVSRYQQQRDLDYATSDIGKANYMADIEAKRKKQAQMIIANPKLAPDKVELAKQILGIKPVESENPLVGKIDQNVIPEESDISKWAKEARDLLGYEDAKKQSIYDAMLAASPGFFKGRTLREAAPNVFESINKSGAFDKPTNIKQAAAQLAIQRKMMQEKAIAEEKTRYGLLKEGKSKDPIERLKALGIDPNQSWAGKLPNDPKLFKNGKFYVDNEGNLVKVEIDEKTKLPILVNFG